MGLEAEFRNLAERLHRLRDALADLRLTAAEDKPLAGDVVLTERVAEDVDDLLGRAEEARAAAAEARVAVGAYGIDLGRALRALARCQESFHAACDRFVGDMTAAERTAELTRLGAERGGEWRAWAQSVHEATDDCRPPLRDAARALSACWQELAEKAVVGRLPAEAQQAAVKPGRGKRRSPPRNAVMAEAPPERS